MNVLHIRNKFVSTSTVGILVLIGLIFFMLRNLGQKCCVENLAVSNPIQKDEDVHISKKDSYLAAGRIASSEDFSGVLCLDGQGIPNFPPICGNPTCLLDLEAPLDNKSHNFDLNTINRNFILHMTGWMKEKHIHIVNMLTHIQWSRGVYGSVGEIGVFAGKYAAVLAAHTDTERGEKFFGCDVFDKIGHGYVELNLEDQLQTANLTEVKDMFLQNMAELGFMVDNIDPTKRLHFFYDSSIYLTKTVFLEMGLPSFRLMSIDGYHYDTYVWHELIQTMCVLRNGGIVVFDDVVPSISKWSSRVKNGLKDFQEMVSSKIISPLILSQNKLYVTSSEWHGIYVKDIEEALKVRTDIKLKKDTFLHDYARSNLAYFVD